MHSPDACADRPPMRVAVIGSPGSGKSVFSRALAQQVGLPLYHLDDFYWREDWTRPAAGEWERIHDELVARERWIIDGNYADTLPDRVAACRVAIFFDVSTPRCLWGLCRRTVSILCGRRWHLPLRIREAPTRQPATGDMRRLVAKVLSFRRRVRPGIVELLAADGDRQVIVVRTGREAIRSLPQIARTVAEASTAR